MSEAIEVGSYVRIPGKDVFGNVAFVGTTQFAAGKWIGVILKKAAGRNNGTVEGVSYFDCPDNHGLFVRQSQVELCDENGVPMTPKSAASTPSARSSIGKRKIEPTSLKRKPTNPVPQKPDRLRLPIAGGTAGMKRTPSSSSGFKASATDLRSTPGSKEGSPRTAEANKRMSASFVEMNTSGLEEDSFLSQTNFVESRSPAVMTQSLRLEERQNSVELANLRAENKDLSEKLETLKIKRAQDKEKLKEKDMLRLQVEQLTEFKSRIMESQTQLQRELAAAKSEAREAAEMKSQNLEDSQDLADTVELLTLDKEMAEEKAETLQIELEQAREKIEELSVDLEILKMSAADANIGSTPATGGIEGEATLVQVKQLEMQNQRLHDTLVKMRDLTAHEKHEMQKLLKEVEAKKTEVTVLSRVKEQLEQQLEQNLLTVSDLQEQVDAALGAEDMVESLTQRNLELEEQQTELEEQVKDLEDINYTNDLLVESAKEQELELREDLDATVARLREVEREKEALGTVIVDKDDTITKFRELTQSLSEQNADLRLEVNKTAHRPVTTPSEVIDFKKLFSETKAHSAAIDLELKELELKQARDHVTYLKQYLPDNFMTRGGDQDSVNLLLLLPRLLWKAEVVIGGVSRFTVPEKIDQTTVLKGHTVDQFAFSARVRQLLHTLQSCVHQFQFSITNGTVEKFLSLGSLYPELAAHERSLDQYVQMLRKDQLDENIGLELLEKIVSSVLTLHASHLPSATLHQPLLLTHLTRAIGAAAELAHTEALRITALMGAGGGTEMPTFMEIMIDSSSELQGIVKRIKRRLPQDGSVGHITYPGEVQASLLQMAASVSQGASTLRHIARACVQQTNYNTDLTEGVSCVKIKELLHEATDIIYGSDDQGPESVKLSLLNTQDKLSAIATSLEKGEYDGTPPQEESEPPIMLRARNIKAELKDSEHIKYKLENKEQDLRDVRLLLKQKNEELSEMVVRRDLAEKKLSTATKDSDATIEKLQRKLDDANIIIKRKEKEYDETMDHLQNDIDGLEMEKRELKEKLMSVGKRTFLDSIGTKAPVSLGSPTTAPPSITPSSGMVTDSPHLLQQIEDLRAALKFTQMRELENKGRDMKRRLANLKPLPRMRREKGQEKKDEEKGDEEEKKDEGKREEKDRVNDLVKRNLHLQEELRDFIGRGCVVSVSDCKVASMPVTQSLKPQHKILLYNSQLANYKKRLMQLQTEYAELVSSKVCGGTVDSNLRTYVSPNMARALREQGKLVKLAEVSVPSKGVEAEIPVVLKNISEINKINQLFIN